MIRNKVSRRNFLRGSTMAAAAGSIGLGVAARSGVASPRDDNQSGSVFQHGIASGDPTQNAVMLWTRVTPAAKPGQGDAKRTVPVQYVVALDRNMEAVVAEGTAQAKPERDFCVKVDVTGLKPGTTYWYVFSTSAGASGNVDVSPLGRTRTLPNLGKDTDKQVKLGLVSCSSYLHGKFNAYKAIADLAGTEEEPDVLIHLGDYIYEYAFDEYGDQLESRPAEPEGEIFKLKDYRDRHAQYKQDADLALLHTLYPMINIWDDHETADNSWSRDAHNHGNRTEGDEEGGVLWYERKNAGRRAFFEWMPIRPASKDAQLLQDVPDAELLDPDDPVRPDKRLDEKYRIYRTFNFGPLADLIMLDTRLLRNADEAANQADFAGINNPDRNLLGAAQTQWLYGDGANGALTGSTAKWQILGQQIMVGQLHVAGTPEDGNVSESEERPGQLPKGGVIFNTDQWDGWQYSRDQLYTAIEHVNGQSGNVVVLTGDIHTSWANDITRYPNNPAHYDPVSGRGSIAAEYVVTSVTSPGLAELATVSDSIRTMNPHMKYIDLKRKGFMLMTVSGTEVRGTWQYLSTIHPDDGDDFSVTAGPTFTVTPGEHWLKGSNPTNQELNPGTPKCDMFSENCPDEAKNPPF